MSPDAIRKYLDGAASKETKFGSYDCVRFAIELLYVGFGKDYRGQLGYWDRRSAVVRLRRAGGLRAAFSAVFGGMVSGDELGPGDLVYYDKPPTIGVVLPGGVVVHSSSRIMRLPRVPMNSGWKT